MHAHGAVRVATSKKSSRQLLDTQAEPCGTSASSETKEQPARAQSTYYSGAKELTRVKRKVEPLVKWFKQLSRGDRHPRVQPQLSARRTQNDVTLISAAGGGDRVRHHRPEPAGQAAFLAESSWSILRKYGEDGQHQREGDGGPGRDQRLRLRLGDHQRLHAAAYTTRSRTTR